MKNRALENILLKNSLKQTIDLIEKCEEGHYTEIRVTKEEGITHDEKLDKKVISYLKKMNVRVIYISEQEYFKSHNKFYLPNKACDSHIHQIMTSETLKAEEKSEMLEELSIKGNKVNRFKIEEESYVACPDCSNILKLS
jgi:hypothetical protein